jgi:hypothetical protein
MNKGQPKRREGGGRGARGHTTTSSACCPSTITWFSRVTCSKVAAPPSAGHPRGPHAIGSHTPVIDAVHRLPSSTSTQVAFTPRCAADQNVPQRNTKKERRNKTQSEHHRFMVADLWQMIKPSCVYVCAGSPAQQQLFTLPPPSFPRRPAHISPQGRQAGSKTMSVLIENHKGPLPSPHYKSM